jgi:hypothetical protein
MSDHGFIALGKFDSARDSILSYLCLADWANESSGNVDCNTGYFSRISNTEADVQMENTEFNSIMAEWLDFNPEVTDSPELRGELVGHFIVQSMDSGFVYVYKYDTEKELLAAYQDLEDQFVAWDVEENGDDGHRI